MHRQLLNRNPKHRLGAQRDAAELKEHPFFNTIDWDALARKHVTPPFKPIVESDESTSNFDPEFTSADVSQIGLVAELKLDDDDPSEDWVSQSVTGGPPLYTPHGPLGSDRPPPLSTTPGIQIQPKRRGRDVASSPPLTNSVQENFRGFTYSGESESLIARVVNRLTEKENREAAVADEEITYPTTDDEALDSSTHAGRYSKRHGYRSDFDDDMNF